MFTKSFWVDLLERAVSTFAETFVALSSVVQFTDWLSLDWLYILITSLIAAGIAVLKGLAVVKRGEAGTPSTVSYVYNDPISGGEPQPEES